jgi:hypothetical protein
MNRWPKVLPVNRVWLNWCIERADAAQPQTERVAARRTKLGDDGNQMQADGNSFPAFILGWTIGRSARVPRAGSGVAPEPFVNPFSLRNEFSA